MSRADSGVLNIGLIGCGRIAETHVQAIQQNPGCKLVGVADVDEGLARRIGAPCGAGSYADYRRLLENERVDAVIICTPPGSHVEIATSCLDRDIHVLCEKPLALTAREAEALVAKAASRGCLLMMASKFRYVDDVTQAKQIIESGILGDIVLYENVFCSRVDMASRWNSNRAISGGGVLIDNGTHSVDIARFLLGPIVAVQAEEGRRVQELQVEDTCRFYFRTASRAMGAVDLSWSLHKERDTYIEVFGPEGALAIGWGGSKYRPSRNTEWVAFGKGYDKLSAFASQLRNFMGSIRGTEAPIITAEDSLESVRVIEAAYRSMQMDKWVAV